MNSTSSVRRGRTAGVALAVLVTVSACATDVSPPRHDAATGNRLGIILVEQRTLLLGGRLEITSVPACGTSIRAIFPTAA